MLAFELAREPVQHLQSALRITAAIRRRDGRACRRTHPFRQLLKYVPLLVDLTSLNECLFPKHLSNCLCKRLGAIDNNKHGSSCIKPSLNEIGQQRCASNGVLGCALPQTDDVL